MLDRRVTVRLGGGQEQFAQGPRGGVDDEAVHWSLRVGLQHLWSGRSEYKAAASCGESWGGGDWRLEMMKGESKVTEAPPHPTHTQLRVLGSSLPGQGQCCSMEFKDRKKGVHGLLCAF